MIISKTEYRLFTKPTSYGGYKQNMKKKIWLLSSCIVSLFATPIVASAENFQSDLQENKQQQIEAKNELSEVKKQKLQVQEEIKASTKKLKKLNEEIKELNVRIENKEKRLIELKSQIERLNKEYKEITALLTNRQEEFKQRVASYYRTEGNISFLNVIFSANSFGEFIEHTVSYRTIVNEDKEFIEEYIANQKKVAAIKEKVETLKESTIQEKKELESIKVTRENDKKEREKLSSLLKKKKRQLEKEEEEKTSALELLEQNEEQIQQIIDWINNPNNHSNSNAYNAQAMKSVIAPFISDAQKLQREKGIPASIILGQILLESSGRYNGLSGLAFEAKNLFGIKGTGTAGSVYMNTTEYVNGQKIRSKEKFAKYKTYYDSMVDHSDLLLTPRYQRYLKDAETVEDYAYGIREAGYATDPNYTFILLGIIDQYGLRSLDSNTEAEVE